MLVAVHLWSTFAVLAIVTPYSLKASKKNPQENVGKSSYFTMKIESLSTDVFNPWTPSGSRIFSSFGCVIDFLSVTST